MTIKATPAIPDPGAHAKPEPRADLPRLREAAEAFEAVFLAEMLGHAGLGRPRRSFGGGAGEDAFASLLVHEQARLLSRRGGIGLAETLFEAMVERSAGR
jgi:Rod binding domain-containing protein